MPLEPDQLRAAPKQTDEPDRRRPWKPPKIEDLPRLTELTLATGDPIGGGGDPGGGTTVF